METSSIKLGTIIWIILLLIAIFYAGRVFLESDEEDGKERKNSNIQLIFAILGVFVALLAIAWNEIPELFNVNAS